MLLRILQRLNHALAALLVTASVCLAQSDELDELFERLQSPDLADWEAIEDRIYDAWSQSGSPAMDLLLERGREAMDDEDYTAAIEHFTALTDHAPDFAEGWNARATAFYAVDLYGPSIADIQRTLALNPRHFGALTGLGLILSEIGYKEEALEAYRAAQAIHPHRPNISDLIEQLEREVGGQDI